MYNGTASIGQTVTITFAGPFFAPPPPPTCCSCRGFATKRADLNGELYCEACFADLVRQVAIANAEAWITPVFLAIGRDQHARAYRQLAALFHPDQGGDPKLMIALNLVRDRLRCEGSART